LFPQDVWDTIEHFQPYNRGQRPGTALLGIVGELVNKDKHRVITPIARQASFGILGDIHLTRTRLNQPDKFLFVVDEAMANKFKPEATFDIVIDVSFLFPNVFSVSDFGKIYSFINNDVIPAFASFFE